VQRRFTVRGNPRNVMVVDDYGHHPTEIRATLAGARASYGDRRLIAILQPHRYTRLRDNFEGFATCMAQADVVCVTDVYPAGEAPIEGATAERLSARVREAMPGKTVLYEPDLNMVPQRLAALARPGDLVITLGAGSITQVGRRLVELLEGDELAKVRQPE